MYQEIHFSIDPIQPDHRGEKFVVPTWCGGMGIFVGVIRDVNHGRDVSHIDYELYEELARNEVAGIISEAELKHNLGSVYVAHRHGTVQIGEYAVVVQTAAKHRGQAIAGCKFIIDEIKHRLPIWKKEWYTDGSYDWPFCHEHHGASV